MTIHPVPKPAPKVKQPKPKKPRARLPKENRPRRAKALVTDFGGPAYIEFIHSLPCDICGVTGYTVAAHLTSRGAGGKAEDLAPLCCTRFVDTVTFSIGTEGCHERFDRYEAEIRKHEPRLRELAKARRSAFLFALEKREAA